MNKSNSRKFSILQLSQIKQQTPKNPSQVIQSFKSFQIQKKIIPAQDHSIVYRPDIDGLRTIAVTIVVIFHAWPNIMIGGFIGVDIFFVISGFLISGIIIKKAKQNQFSYKDFYTRRIKRIFPALIIVLFFAFFVTIYFLQPYYIGTVSGTLFASTIFSANIQILKYKQGYFAPILKINPLLHLWSLGVEQQFYIIWPLIIVFAFKKLRSKLFTLFGALTIFSFIYSIYQLKQDPSFAFYFPLCRFWQLSIGGLLAYKNVNIYNKYYKNILSFVGLTAILITIWIVNQKSDFPGFWALIPTLSAAFIISSGSESLINKYLLSSKPFVFIGKISYPLYLWHWPLLVFSKILYPKGSTSIFTYAFPFVIASIIFSIITYYFIENKIRFRKQKIFIIILIVLMSIISLFSILAYYNLEAFSIQKYKLKQYVSNQSIPQQQDMYIKNSIKIPNSSMNKNRKKPTRDQLWYSSAFQHSRIFNKIQKNSIYYDQNILKLPEYFQILNEGNDKKLFIIGDSHSQVIRPRFLQLYINSLNENTSKQFPTIISINKCAQIFYPCSQYFTSIMSYIKKHKPNRILFVHHWLLYLSFKYRDGEIKKYNSCQQQFHYNQQTYADVVNTLKVYTNIMKQLMQNGIQVYQGGIHPEGEEFDPKIMIDFTDIIEENIKIVKKSQFQNKNHQIINLFNKSMNEANITLIDFTDNYCYQDICNPLTPQGFSVKRDINHFRYDYVKNWITSVDFLTKF